MDFLVMQKFLQKVQSHLFHLAHPLQSLFHITGAFFWFPPPSVLWDLNYLINSWDFALQISFTQKLSALNITLLFSLLVVFFRFLQYLEFFVVLYSERCEPLPLLRNGYAVTSDNTHLYGSQVILACNPGHRFNDGLTSKSVTCLTNGQWEDTGACLGIFSIFFSFYSLLLIHSFIYTVLHNIILACKHVLYFLMQRFHIMYDMYT